MRKVLSAVAAALVGLGTLASAEAVVITKTYYVSATNYKQGGSLEQAPPPLVTTWDLSFTLTFDPAVDVGGGQALDSFSSTELNGGGYGPYTFRYYASNRQLIIGDNCIGGTPCSYSLSGQPDALLSLFLTDLDAPVFHFSNYYFSGFGYNTSTGTASTQPIVATVPEPGTLALLGLGLAGLAASRRRKHSH